MAVTVYDYKKNQWYVEYADGTQEPCHNRATAETLKKAANDEREVAVIHVSEPQLQQQEAC